MSAAIAPCNMLLGNAILHVASLDPSVFTTGNATVVMEGFELDSDECRRLALKYGHGLAIRE